MFFEHSNGQSRVFNTLIIFAVSSLLIRQCLANVIWDNGGYVTTGAYNMSQYLQADDFELEDVVSITTIRFWAVWAPYPSVFSGTIGWAFYNDYRGKPSSIITSGFDNSPTITDTGDSIQGYPISQLDLDVGSVVLGEGSYWIGLHEGLYGSPFDGTSIYWVLSSIQQGYGKLSDNDLLNPNWNIDSNDDLSFQLIPEPSTLLLLGLGAVMLRKKRSWTIFTLDYPHRSE